MSLGVLDFLINNILHYTTFATLAALQYMRLYISGTSGSGTPLGTNGSLSVLSGD